MSYYWAAKSSNHSKAICGGVQRAPWASPKRLKPHSTTNYWALTSTSKNVFSLPPCIAAKSPTSTKSSGTQGRALTLFLLGVDPNKPPHKPNQKKRTQTARNISDCQHLPIVLTLPSSDPTIKNMRAEQTGDQKRLTLVWEIYLPCRSKRCASRIIPPRHYIVWFWRCEPPPAIKPYSPPRDPLTTPGTPSESQESDTADGAGVLPSWQVFDCRVWPRMLSVLPFEAWIWAKFVWNQTILKPSTGFGWNCSQNRVTSHFLFDWLLTQKVELVYVRMFE